MNWVGHVIVCSLWEEMLTEFLVRNLKRKLTWETKTKKRIRVKDLKMYARTWTGFNLTWRGSNCRLQKIFPVLYNAVNLTS
jgi:hypothetical protein